MNALEKYAAKQRLTGRLCEAISSAGGAQSAKPKLNKTAQLSAVGKAIGKLTVPKIFGKTLGGLPLSRAYQRAMGAVARNPGKTALGLTGAGGLAYMAGRASR